MRKTTYICIVKNKKNETTKDNVIFFLIKTRLLSYIYYIFVSKLYFMSWIDKIANGIDNILSSVRAPLNLLPPLLLICEVHNRPGLSAIASTGAIIKRLPEANIETGVNNCGSPNMNNQFIRIVCEELVKEIKDNARVTCIVEPLKLNSVSISGNAVVNSQNTIISDTKGIIE